MQLSSPIEEIVLTKLSGDEGEEKDSVALFRGVETSVATITCEVMDKEIPLGISASFDVAPLCEFDAKDPKPKITQMDVAIVPSSNLSRKTSVYMDAVEEIVEDMDIKDSSSSEDVVVVSTADESTQKEEEKNEKKESITESSKEEEKGDDIDVVEEQIAEKKESTAETKEEASDETTLEIPICTVTLSVEFNSSKKDQMDAFYELLNTATKRKAAAIDNLRKSASAVGRTSTAPAQTEVASKVKSAVKSGFLNKKKKEAGFFKKMYEKTIGPQSLLRMTFPILKNYCLFFGAVALMHYRGNDLALPPPV